MSEESNYDIVRERVGLERWDYDKELMVTREPTPAELLRLLDALNADIKGEELSEVGEILRDRRWNS